MKKPNGREGLPLAASDIEQARSGIEDAAAFIRKQPHAPHCASQFGDEDERCTCGRDDLLDGLHNSQEWLTKASTSEGDPRRSKMVEAGNAMREFLSNLAAAGFIGKIATKVLLAAWDAAIGGEDGGGPLSGDGGGDLGASAETADRSTPPAGEDAEHPATPLRARAQADKPAKP